MTDQEIIKNFKDLIVRLDDTADAEDYHAFVACLEDHYRDGFYHEVYRFMIRQARRVGELEQKNKKVKDGNYGLSKIINTKRKENNQYKQALEFYADEDNYDDVEYEDFDSNGELISRNMEGLIEQDSGYKARQALKEGEK